MGYKLEGPSDTYEIEVHILGCRPAAENRFRISSTVLGYYSPTLPASGDTNSTATHCEPQDLSRRLAGTGAHEQEPILVETTQEGSTNG